MKQCARANEWTEGSDYVLGYRFIWLTYAAWELVEDVIREVENSILSPCSSSPSEKGPVRSIVERYILVSPNSRVSRSLVSQKSLTLRSSFRKALLIPPEIEPMNIGTTVGGCENCWCSICCWCANAPMEGPCPNEGMGCLMPRPRRLGVGCFFVCVA